MGIGERGKAAATDLCFAFRYINITMAFSRTFVLLMALMALVVSSVNAAPPSSRFCGRCLLNDSRIDTRLAKKAFRFIDEPKEDFCFAEFGEFSPGLVYEVIRGPNSNGRCKVACRNIVGFCSISGEVCTFDIFDITSQPACGQLVG